LKRSGSAGAPLEKPIHWVGTSLDDLSSFPRRPKTVIGYALRLAQRNEMHDDAKPMHGPFSGLTEIVAHDENRTFRAVYLAKLADVLYVLHVFCKKSKHGIATPQRELNVVERRWKVARKHHQEHHAEARS
jgi:phage-related protein